MMGDSIQSNGEVIGRDSQSGVPRGEIEAAPFSARRGGPQEVGGLLPHMTAPEFLPLPADALPAQGPNICRAAECDQSDSLAKYCSRIVSVQ